MQKYKLRWKLIFNILMNDLPKKLHHQPDIYTVHSNTLKEQNSILLKNFLTLYLKDDVKRIHLFNDRYENIYLNKKHIPALSQFESIACEYANQILSADHINLGYWFNYMPPGSVTTAHNHDDEE